MDADVSEPGLNLKAAAATDRGRMRPHNEDSHLCLPELGVFCVADGIGGAAGGAIASMTTVEQLHRVFHDIEQSARGEGSFEFRKQMVYDAMNRASSFIREQAEREGLRGAGTTAVTLVFDQTGSGRASVLHAGDSRAYRFRNGALECLTRDHSLASEAGFEGDDADASPISSIITRAIGMSDRVEMDESMVDVLPGDIYLLCSDGLNRMLSHSLLEQLFHVEDRSNLQQMASTFVAEANRAGGRDNITVVLVHVGPDNGVSGGPDFSDDSEGEQDRRLSTVLRSWFRPSR